jgi:hypothetical protein
MPRNVYIDLKRSGESLVVCLYFDSIGVRDGRRKRQRGGKQELGGQANELVVAALGLLYLGCGGNCDVF